MVDGDKPGANLIGCRWPGDDIVWFGRQSLPLTEFRALYPWAAIVEIRGDIGELLGAGRMGETSARA